MATIEPRRCALKDGRRVTIRSAVRDDAERILAILDAAVAEGGSTLTEPGERTTTAADEGSVIAEHAQAPGKLYLVMEADGEVAGWISFENGRYRRTAHRGELSIFIDPAWRERGLGACLLGEVLAWTTQSPLIEKVALAVFSTNERAIALYRKLGFIEEGRCPGDMKLADGSYIDSVLMYRLAAGGREQINPLPRWHDA